MALFAPLTNKGAGEGGLFQGEESRDVVSNRGAKRA